MTIKRNLLYLTLLLATGFIGQAPAESGNESAVKTAFLYNFFKFIAWPDAAPNQEVFSLCTTSLDALGDSLQVLKNKTIGATPITITRGVSDNNLKHCHLVFISTSSDIPAIVNRLKGLPIVTVSDTPDFINQGGMIGLVQVDNRLGFEINLDAANASSVHIGAQMLKLAKRVNSEK